MDSVQTKNNLGFLLGLAGVAGFSITLPATRVAVSYLDATLVGLGRSMVAAVLAVLLLWLTRQPWPSRQQARGLLLVALCVVIGFPLLSSFAMRGLPAAHAGIIVAVLPLLTAMASALRRHERPSLGFWLVSISGSVLVVAFSIWSAGGVLQGDDVVLFVAAIICAFGYAEGGELARQMGGWQVISWALLIAAPFSAIPVAYSIYHSGLVAPASAWIGFAYVAVISQFLAFIFWYQGLAMGGVASVSQVQLLQPFLTLVAAMLLLGENVSAAMGGFAIAVVMVVAIARKMPVHRLS